MLSRRQLESATAHVQKVEAGAAESEECARAAQRALQQVRLSFKTPWACTCWTSGCEWAMRARTRHGAGSIFLDAAQQRSQSAVCVTVYMYMYLKTG